MKIISLKDDGAIVALLFRRIGDSLLATPALRAIKETYPHSSVVVICEPQVTRVFEGLKFIDKIVNIGKSPSPLRLMRIIRSEHNVIALMDFLSDPRSAAGSTMSGVPIRTGFPKSIRRFAYTHPIPLQVPTHPIYSSVHKAQLANALGAQTQNFRPAFALTENDVTNARQALKQFVDQRKLIIGMFVSSRRAYKRWPLDRFAAIIRAVKSHDINVVLVGGPGESQDAREVCRLSNLSEQNTVMFADIGSMAAFLAECNLYIGNDGGPKHLAVAMGTPTLTVFQNDPPEYWTPPDDPIHVAVGGVNQSPSAEEVSRAALLMLDKRK